MDDAIAMGSSPRLMKARIAMRRELSLTRTRCAAMNRTRTFPMSSDENVPPPRKRRRIGRKLLWVFGILLVVLIWLNGPGWRWLGGIAARKSLEGTDFTADFELTGTLTGGIGVKNLTLSGGVIRKLEIGSVEPIYDITRAIRGEIGGVRVDQIHAIIDLAAAPEDPDEPDKPFDSQALGDTLRKVREILLPMDLDAAGLRLQLVRGEELLLTLDSSDLSHSPGSDEFRMDFGDLAVAAGYAFDAQESRLVWKEESLTLDRFDLTGRLGIRDLRVAMPRAGGFAASGQVAVEDSRLVIDSTLSSTSVRLEGEPLVVQEALKNVAIGLPVDVTVRSLEANLENFDQSPDQWQASARAEVIDFRYEDWQANALTVAASKAGETATATWTLDALGASLPGRAELIWRTLDKGQWRDFEATAAATVPRLSPVFAELKGKFEFAPEDAPPLPSSSLTLDATLDSGPAGFRSATGKLVISPDQGDLPTLSAAATSGLDGRIDGTFETAGLRSNFGLDLEAGTYQAEATLESFRPETLDAWVAATGLTVPAGMNATGTWQGSGAFAARPHRGRFEVPSFEWVRPDMPPLIVRTTGSYAWPEEIVLSDLTAIAEGQTIRTEARFADGVLKIPRLEWLDGETLLVSGQAEIPIPDDPANSREFLRQTEPLNLFLESEWIDHSRLSAWLPRQDSPLPEGRARVNLIVSGTPAAPKIDLDAELQGLKLPDQPDVPVTDAKLTLDGAGETLELDGEIRPAGYEPVTLSGKMPFKPGIWAEDVDAMLEESFEVRANIPRLELATFKEMLPATEQLAGTLEGFFTAGGTLGNPQVAGELRLAGGAFELVDSPVPPITEASALLRLEGKELRLESIALESAGGTLRGDGSANLEDVSDPGFEISLRGNALPIKRDESMIIRANANLSLRGNLQDAGISGTVEIVDSIYYRDFEILPVRVPFTAPSRPSLPSFDREEAAGGVPSPFAGWTLDVRVTTRDPILVRGNLANGSAVADVRFGGTLGDLQPSGQAVINDVEAKLPFSTLNVRNGTVTFTPEGGLNPDLNIRGTSNIGRYHVSVFFYGPANDPKTALTSDPPLPESEIMTLLATGTTSEGLEDGQAATLKAAQLLLEEWRRGRLPFGEQVEEVLAVLNRVDVRIGEDDPLTGRRLNSATLEVTDRVHVSGSVDKQGNTRLLGAFVLRFK